MKSLSFFRQPQFFFFLFLCFAAITNAARFVVINTNDSGDGTFRQAILDANDSPGADSIIFNISTSDNNFDINNGVWTIRPDSTLPDVTDDSTLIDATTQAGFIGSDSNPHGPEIELDGTNAGDSDGIILFSSYNVIKGLVINRFQKFGIEITFEDANGNIVAGNYIGTDVTGTIDLGNGFSGVILYNGAKHNIIGGATEEERNIISGNNWSGVEIQAWDADSNIVIGNYIGTDVTGHVNLGNEHHGIHIWSSAQYNRIGGLNHNERNVISGSGWEGISIGGPASNFNTVVNNIIGMNKDATMEIPNDAGISVGSDSNLVGGTIPEEANIISGNGNAGIVIGGKDNIIAGNYIGTETAGNSCPNHAEGIYLLNGARDNIIGPDNKIHFNMNDGIIVDGTNTIANKITLNSITGNSGAGINNVNGGNIELPPPVISGYSNGLLQGTAPPNCVVEIFSDTQDEGEIFEVTVTTDASGNFSWTGTLTGPYITATATDASGNTSEFSAAVRIVDLVVTNTNDAGNGSLRWAIEEVNRNAGPDTILFNIAPTDPGFDGAVWKIQLNTPLPVLTDDSTFINGLSQGLAQGEPNMNGPEIMIDGSLLTDNKWGLELKSSFNSIAGLIISHCDWTGININGDNARHNHVWGNFIGINPAGNDTLANGYGIGIVNGPKHNIIGGHNENERNIVSGNTYVGIEINNADSNMVIGNYVGTDITGTKDVGNLDDGIVLSYGARYNRIGGGSPGEGNVISGNDDNGVNIFAQNSDENVVSGNFIGTDKSGRNKLGNGENGILISNQARSNVIGGFSQGEGNIVSGNGDYGIIINNDVTNNNIIANNRIGTDIDGLTVLGNERDGVFISNRACNNVIGPNNIISGNKINGIRINGEGTDSTIIYGNWIGLDVTGQDTLSNVENGIQIEYGARYVVIGGPSEAERNVIAGNKWQGIRLYADSTGYAQIINNYIGTSADGRKALGNDYSGIELSGVRHLVQYNLISGNLQHGIKTLNNSKNIIISENIIGIQADRIHELKNGYAGVRIEGNASIYAIGPENQIWYNGWEGIELCESTVSEITITANSISNNAEGGIRFYNGPNNNITVPVITNNSPLTGTAVPNCTIEVFSDYSDQGRIYEGFVSSDAMGNWTWTGTMTGPNMTVTATDADGNTSEFSDEIQISTDKPLIINPIRDLSLHEDFGDHLVVRNLYSVFRNTIPDTIMTFSSTSLDTIVQPNIRSDSLLLQSVPNAFGIDEVVVTAMNTAGLVVSDTFSTTILPVNDPPVFSDLPDTLYLNNDSSVQMNIWQYVNDVETTDSLLTYQFIVSNDSLLANFNEETGILSLSALNDFAGFVSLLYTVFDDSNAAAKDSSVVMVENVTGLQNTTNQVPTEFNLYQNYPNPFNPSTIIQFDLPEASYVELRIYNITGQVIETLVSGNRKAGIYRTQWNASHYSNGIYFYKIQAGDFFNIKKMILMK